MLLDLNVCSTISLCLILSLVQQMLCEERGFFLEIADLIRGMGLTILKGVMEARNDKIWARFAVEVTFLLKALLCNLS